MSIRRKLLLIFLLTLVLMTSLGGYAAHVYRESAARAAELRAASRVLLESIHELHLDLQKSSTAWKNVLLRGSDSDKYYQYLSAFYAREREARQRIRGLHELVTEDSGMVPLLSDLTKAHHALGLAQREAIHVFNSELNNPHLFADQVAGPHEARLDALLKQLSDQARQIQNSEITALNAEIRKDEYLLLLFLVMIGGGTAALFFWLLDKNIGRPAEQATFLANYDPLTSLPNRTLFRDRLDHAMSRTRRNGRPLTLLFFDLDHFKSVNDALGHHRGDELLQQVGERLRRCVRDSDTPARLGGDEFAVILEDLPHEKDVVAVAQKILDAMALPFDIGQQQAYVSASIGITRYPQDADSASELLQHADAAMYLAKRKGRSRYHFFTENLNRAAQQRLRLESQLRTALAHQQFELHFQPQVALSDGRLVGAEALLRFSPDGSPVPPDVFVPVLEETGLIVPVGRWVLEQACRYAAELRERHGCDVRIAVNLSARQLQRPDFVDTVAQALHDSGLPARCLEAEITEHHLIEAGTGDNTLAQLRALGVRLAIDDFGTGYSSLSYLKSFAVDLLKIDRSFIRDITHDRDDDAVTSAIIALAHKLDIEVIAEGVETIEQQAFLLQHQCDCAQGFLFSRPLPADDFEDWFAQRRQRQHIDDR